MPLIDVPTAEDGDALDDWKTIAKIARVLNALDSSFQVVPSTVRNKLTLTESGAKLELMLGAGGTAVAAPVLRRWQPYAAPFTGTGSPPANQGLFLKIRPCWVWDGYQNWFPSNMNASFPVPADCTDAFYFWLQASIGPNGQLTALQIQSGPDGPPRAPDANLTTGAPPPVAYYSLFHVTSNDTAVDDYSNLYAPDEPLQILPIQVALGSPTTLVRLMRWYPYSSDPLAANA